MKKTALALSLLFLLASCGGNSSSSPESPSSPDLSQSGNGESTEKPELLYGLSFDEERGETTRELV